MAIEPVNREELRTIIEHTAHQGRVLQERTTAELTVLDQHLTRHVSQEREASTREWDPSARRQRENVAAAIEHDQNRYQKMAKSVDRETFLAWTEVGRDESRMRRQRPKQGKGERGAFFRDSEATYSPSGRQPRCLMARNTLACCGRNATSFLARPGFVSGLR